MDGFQKILIVCIGNICRSPVAEALFKKHPQFSNTESAGLADLSGKPAADYAIEVSRENGIDLTGHVAQKITEDHIVKADLILCMELDQITTLIKQHPYAAGKTFLLGYWENNKGIIDPYKRPKEAFDAMFIKVQESVNEWIKRLK